MRHAGRAALAVLLVAAGCGRAPATLAELPAYPGAVELAAGDIGAGDTVASAMRRDASARAAAGLGGRVEQKGYRLPPGARWGEVRAFYAERLGAAGWKPGAGGRLAAGIAANVLGLGTRGRDPVESASWSRDGQTVTVLVVSRPDDQPGELVVSLSTR